MKNFIKHYLWFVKESARFLDCNFAQFVAKGGLNKAYNHAKFMVKWDKLTSEQRENWYLSGEGRILEL